MMHLADLLLGSLLLGSDICIILSQGFGHSNLLIVQPLSFLPLSKARKQVMPRFAANEEAVSKKAA